MTRFLLTTTLAAVMSVASFSAMADDTVKVGDHVVTHHKAHHPMHKMTTTDTRDVYVRDVPVSRWSGKDVQVLQQSLRDSGFYKAPVSGVWDQETANAVASYQYAHGLALTGTLNEETAKKLGLQPMAMEKVGGTMGDNVTPMPRHVPMHHAHVVHHTTPVVEKTTTTTTVEKTK